MTHQIFIGYRLKLAATPEMLKGLSDKYIAGLEIPPSYKGNAKEAPWVDNKRTEWMAAIGETPYLATFDEVSILVPSKHKGVILKSEGRAPGGKKPPICVAVRNFLLGKEMFPKAWSEDTHPGGIRNPEAAFMGFNPRLFLKILGLECSLPVHDCPLPAEMWYGNTDHRDIAEAVMPATDCGRLRGDWEFIVQARRLGLKDDHLKEYDAIVAGWTGPGKDPDKDARLACEWAVQLGFVPPDKE